MNTSQLLLSYAIHLRTNDIHWTIQDAWSTKDSNTAIRRCFPSTVAFVWTAKQCALIYLTSYLPASLGSRHALNVLTSMALGLLTVNKVQATGLGLAVNEGTRKPSHDILGLLVALGLACCLPLMSALFCSMFSARREGPCSPFFSQWCW